MAKRKNSRLFTVGNAVSVDMETGAETPIEGGGLKMLPGPRGTCEWCHVKHDPEQPHNQQSLPYQMKFHTLKGRWPTWMDAMAHCSDEVKSIWVLALIEQHQKNGLKVPNDLLNAARYYG